jgi:hypothetical protein
MGEECFLFFCGSRLGLDNAVLVMIMILHQMLVLLLCFDTCLLYICCTWLMDLSLFAAISPGCAGALF